MLTKITVEAALNAELDAHPGYDRHAHSDNPKKRNGISKKQVLTEDGSLELDLHRDRESSFEPRLTHTIVCQDLLYPYSKTLII